MTIRKKLTIWYAGLLTVIILIFSMTVFSVLRVSMLNSIDQTLDETASNVIDDIRISIHSNEIGKLEAGVRLTSQENFRIPNMSVQVWQTNNIIDLDFAPTLAKTSDDLVNFSQALNPQSLNVSHEVFESVEINQTPLRVATRPFYSAGQPIGVIQVATSIASMQQVMDTLLIIMLIASVITIGVAIGLGMWLSKRTLKPIGAISDAASQIAETENLSTRLQWEGPMDELGRLTTVFNHMMTRIEGVFKVQQQFIADASHELRTPLTVLQGNLELVKRYGLNDGIALEAITSETRRLVRMVNDLLLLARADYGDVDVKMSFFDLDRIVMEVYEQGLMLLKKRPLNITIKENELTQIWGNEDRIRQLILNLIVNAIKFTPDGGEISLSNYCQGDTAYLVVEDTGIGIPQDHLKHIFARFYQVDNARTHTDENDGSGLGLSIVKWIVELHQGSIKVLSSEGIGTKFIVTLPLQPQTKTNHVAESPFIRSSHSHQSKQENFHKMLP